MAGGRGRRSGGTQSTTTTAGTFALNGGTGTNCGTGGYAVLPASGTANRYGYPASSAAATVLTFGTPIKLTAATALCARTATASPGASGAGSPHTCA